MPKFLLLLTTITILFSCNLETEQKEDPYGGNNKDLENKIKQLELDIAMKDSVINESLAFFNEVRDNLEAIGARKDNIRMMSKDPEFKPDDKQWILDEIKQINFLREENDQLIERLKKQLNKNGLDIVQLNEMIDALLRDIQWKDDEINLLQAELDRLDKDYAELFEAYQHAALSLDLLTDEVNTVFYAYGSEEELVSNKVLERTNGFLGFGKKTALKDGFNDKYFTPIDATKEKNITIEGKSIRMVTAHSHTSYKLKVKGNMTTIQILDPSEFWKVSKYLVVVKEVE